MEVVPSGQGGMDVKFPMSHPHQVVEAPEGSTVTYRLKVSYSPLNGNGEPNEYQQQWEGKDGEVHPLPGQHRGDTYPDDGLHYDPDPLGREREPVGGPNYGTIVGKYDPAAPRSVEEAFMVEANRCREQDLMEENERLRQDAERLERLVVELQKENMELRGRVGSRAFDAHPLTSDSPRRSASPTHSPFDPLPTPSGGSASPNSPVFDLSPQRKSLSPHDIYVGNTHPPKWDQRGGLAASLSNEGTSALHQACADGDLRRANELAESFGVNVRTEHGNTPLHYCFLHGLRDNTLPIARMLVRRGVDVNAKGAWGFTALMWAAQVGCLSALEFLIQECGADFTIRDVYAQTAVQHASHPEALRYLKVADGSRPLERRAQHLVSLPGQASRPDPYMGAPGHGGSHSHSPSPSQSGGHTPTRLASLLMESPSPLPPAPQDPSLEGLKADINTKGSGTVPSASELLRKGVDAPQQGK